MKSFRLAGAVLVISALVLPAAALAQTAPISQVIITTQTSPGVSAPPAAPLVSVSATEPSLSGTPGNMPLLTYASSFVNDVRTVTFIPGSYSITASAPGYYFTYSPNCSGSTPVSGAVRSCTITLTTTPPQSTTCASGGCTPPPTPYTGPIYQSRLACAPSYQTVKAGQPVTLLASGGSGSYNWTTPGRTFLNTGPSLTTILQTLGTQVIVVDSGVQSATCTVNVVAAAGPVSFGTPSVTSSYIPSLPNTGFAPQDGALAAFALVLLAAAGIFLFPYVRKAVAIVSR